MAAKNNIRSIRFSDDMKELIEQQVGDTFQAKFEALVTKCVWELPQREMELKKVREDIAYERERLKKIQTLENDLEKIGWTVENIRRSVAALDIQTDRLLNDRP